MAEGFLFYSALSDLNFGYITEATAFAVAQSVKKVKQKCLAFSLICGIINMVMKGAENRKTRKTSDRICMYGRADTGRPSAQKNR